MDRVPLTIDRSDRRRSAGPAEAPIIERAFAVRLAGMMATAMLLALWLSPPALASNACWYPVDFPPLRSGVAKLDANAPFETPCVRMGEWHASKWFAVFFSLKNLDSRVVVGVRAQANLIDAFGSIVETWPILTTVGIAHNVANPIAFSEKPGPATAAADRVEIFILAIKYADGSIWTSEQKPATGPTPSPGLELSSASRW